MREISLDALEIHLEAREKMHPGCDLFSAYKQDFWKLYEHGGRPETKGCISVCVVVFSSGVAFIVAVIPYKSPLYHKMSPVKIGWRQVISPSKQYMKTIS